MSRLTKEANLWSGCRRLAANRSRSSQSINCAKRPWLHRNISQVVPNHRPFRMAIIGSGPAGFYSAYRTMSIIEGAKIDMYESLPVPFGLVRFGVAPDHPEVKVRTL